MFLLKFLFYVVVIFLLSCIHHSKTHWVKFGTIMGNYGIRKSKIFSRATHLTFLFLKNRLYKLYFLLVIITWRNEIFTLTFPASLALLNAKTPDCVSQLGLPPRINQGYVAVTILVKSPFVVYSFLV